MTSEAQKRAMKKYLASARGQRARRKAQDRYNHSPKGKLARQIYLKSCKGKEVVRASRERAALLSS